MHNCAKAQLKPICVQDKDEFLIPLLLYQRVSASEFQDLLLREIQLSSLFGVCVLQV